MKVVVITLTGIVVILSAIFYFYLTDRTPKISNPASVSTSQVTPSITLAPTGSPSAAQPQSEEETLKTAIRTALIAEHGQDAANLNITVSNISGDYAQGGASQEGMGGGMWFAAKVGGEWKLVWDGNGIITCASLADYPDFPASMIPQCFDQQTQEMVER